MAPALIDFQAKEKTMSPSSFHPERRVILKRVAIAAMTFSAAISAVHAEDEATEERLSATDRQFLRLAAEAGNTVIAASRSARGKAISPVVKSFAATLETDHLKISDALKHLAAVKGTKVSDEPSMDQQEVIANLNRLEKAEFDRQFVGDIGVAALRDAVALYRKAAGDAEDRDVQTFAAKTLRILEQHLGMAENLSTARKRN